MNSELSRAFERIADLLEISGGDPFRVSTYRRVTRIIRDLNDDIRVLHEAGVVREIKGIGKSTAAKIEEFLETGSMETLRTLEKKVPAGLPQLLEIQGLGPKKVALFYRELGITHLKDLTQAIASGQLAALPGMGARSVLKITEGIEFLQRTSGRTPRGVAWAIAEELATFLKSLPDVERVEVAGSLRRGADTVGDIDLLASAEDGEPIVRAFVEHSRARRVLASGSTKGSVTVESDPGREVQVDLRVVPASSFGAALQYFTGSKDHNVRLRERATKRQWKLNEWGLFEGDKAIAGAEEAGIYEALDLPLIPPELREDRDEFEKSAADFAELVEVSHLRGDLHTHTTASDGKSSIEEMGHAARELGYEYLAITDHSQSSLIANGLNESRLVKHLQAIRRVNETMKGITIWGGCECDILSDGRLDYPDELLAQCDIVVASIHAAMRPGAKTKTGTGDEAGTGAGAGKMSPTERTLRAIGNRWVTIIGHPTGRLINKRPAMELDMPRIIAAARDTGTVLEVNAAWKRLDLKGNHVRQAIQGGVRLSIDTDAHHADHLGRVEHGVCTARRGAARASDIINTWPLETLRDWIARKRESQT